MPNKRIFIVKLWLVFCLPISLSDIQNANSFSSFRASRNKNIFKWFKGLDFSNVQGNLSFSPNARTVVASQTLWTIRQTFVWTSVGGLMSVENSNSFLLLLHRSHFMKSSKCGQSLWVQKLLRKLINFFLETRYFPEKHVPLSYCCS